MLLYFLEKILAIDVETLYPIVVFYVGDMDNPKTLYGKQVFSLCGEFPGDRAGVPKRWFKLVHRLHNGAPWHVHVVTLAAVAE